MKKLIACSILFFSAVFVFANQIIFSLSDTHLEGKLYEQDFYIDEVIDARPEKHCLGFVHKGIANHKVPAYFPQSLEKEFLEFFAKTFKNEKGKEPITVRVNHLFIYDAIDQDLKFAFAELNLSFLKKNNGNYIELLEVGTSVIKAGMDEKKYHPWTIVRATGKCFDEFNEKRKKGRLHKRIIPASEVIKYPLGNRDYPIFNHPTAKLGIYKTFNDFRENNPQPVDSLDLEYYEEKDIDLVTADLYWGKSIPKEEHEVWGFNDGENNFIRIGKSFYKITKEGSEFRVFAPMVKNNSSGVIIGSALGGAIGGMIGGMINESNFKYDKYKIDFVTGNILPLKEPYYRKIQSYINLISSRYSKKEMILKINGEEKCKLAAGEYLKLSFQPEINSVELCALSENGETCETIVLELFEIKTYLLSGFKKKPPKVDLPNKNLLREVVQEIEEGKIIEVCFD